jgi:phosphohistidine phosphatase
MKQLILLRHAKSSWDDPDLADFDRPLGERGIRTAPLLGKEMAARRWLPDKAIVSSALRTRDTWRMISAEWPNFRPLVSFSDDIYEAPSEKILKVIRGTEEAIETLLVVGHNPGLEHLGKLLASRDSAEKAMRRLNRKFPTGALARFTFYGPWAELDFASATLTHCVKPKDIEETD